uniref:NADH-ubiquinone oxidoreductase chain 4L n=1 Tax=Aclees cribratus TaxID=2735253 RepID=A0A7L8XIV6_9CUCU|nr:NADH dehydrogenase subunit 4L [Aclees cribratus]QOH97071.1 NADH dehydrogenase subunit 4L [Aclees cribratus]QZI85936.1 NADH dehydrogenase subunit 4L [Aclees taiwanensis]
MLMYYYSYSLVGLFLSSLFMFISKYKHLLLMLLSLESIVLSLYMLIMFYLNQYMFEYFMLMFFLSMSVCESALGLSLLILMIRTHGSDFIMMFDNLW